MRVLTTQATRSDYETGARFTLQLGYIVDQCEVEHFTECTSEATWKITAHGYSDRDRQDWRACDEHKREVQAGIADADLHYGIKWIETTPLAQAHNIITLGEVNA